MKEKDPYLSELDEIDVAEDEGDEFGQDEPTRIDLDPPKAEPKSASPTHEGEVDPLVPDELTTSGLMGLTSDMPVELVAVMGRKGITVKDLLAFRVGEVVSFHKNPLDAVEIVANGKVIGRGELVDVDGKLGVRILKLLK